jgi:hypothetical protein
MEDLLYILLLSHTQHLQVVGNVWKHRGSDLLECDVICTAIPI